MCLKLTSLSLNLGIPYLPRRDADAVKVLDLLDNLDRPCYVSPYATLGYAIDEMVSLRASCLLTCTEEGNVTGIVTVR